MLDIRDFENVDGTSLEEFNKTINLLVSEAPPEKASDSLALAMPEGDRKRPLWDESGLILYTSMLQMGANGIGDSNGHNCTLSSHRGRIS